MHTLGKTMFAVALAGLTGFMNAQTTTPGHRGTRHEQTKKLGPDERAQKEAARMTEKLGLNEEQKQKWLDASRERYAANAPLKQKMEGSTTPEERTNLKKEMRSNAEIFNNKVMGFLNDEQKKKLEDQRKKHQSQNKQHRKDHLKGPRR